jgi:hypothetical protein
MSGINVMLNTKDVSEYLKISPDGLEVSSQCSFTVRKFMKACGMYSIYKTVPLVTIRYLYAIVKLTTI